jgi:hypothetical protein
MTGAKVYIPMKSDRYDFSSAQTYGTLVPVFTKSVYPDTVSERLMSTLRALRASMSKYDPEVDYLLLSGDHFLCSLMVAVLPVTGKMHMKILKFDGRSKVYFPINLDFRDLLYDD